MAADNESMAGPMPVMDKAEGVDEWGSDGPSGTFYYRPTREMPRREKREKRELQSMTLFICLQKRG
eukprot:4437021-Prorocentrum_lima.AAC.1